MQCCRTEYEVMLVMAIMIWVIQRKTGIRKEEKVAAAEV